MKHLCIICCLIFANFNLFAQQDTIIFYNQLVEYTNIDSIENVLKNNNKNDFNKLFVLYSIEKTNYIKSNKNSGYWLDTIQKIEQSLHINSTKGLLHYFKGNLYLKENKLFDAYKSYSQAIQNFKTIKDSFGIAQSLISISIIPKSDELSHKTNFENLDEAEKIAVKLDNTKLLVRLYMAYLNLYISTTNFQNSKINKIIEKLERSIKGKKDENWALAYFYTNLGIINSKIGKEQESIIYFKKAQKYLIENKEEHGILLNYYNLALTYYSIKDYKNCMISTDKAIELARNNFPIDLKNCYNLKIEIFKNTNQFDKGLVYYDSLYELTELLYENEKEKELNEIRTKNNTQQIVLANENLMLKDEFNTKSKKLLIIFLISAIVLIIIITYLFYKARKQKSKISDQKSKLEELSKTKDYFLTIIAHDIKQPIVSHFGINKTLRFFIKQNNQEKIDNLINSIDKSSMKTLKIIDNLFYWSFIQNNEKVHIQEDILLKTKIQEVISRFILDQFGVDIIINIDENRKINFDIVDFEIVVRNLLDNSIKYGNPTIGKKIFINDSNSNSDYLQLEIIDNGIGMNAEMQQKLKNLFHNPSEFHPKIDQLGFGLVLVSKLIILNNCKIELVESSDLGTKLVISQKHMKSV